MFSQNWTLAKSCKVGAIFKVDNQDQISFPIDIMMKVCLVVFIKFVEESSLLDLLICIVLNDAFKSFFEIYIIFEDISVE
jgi:hypothetical protein